MAKRIKKPVVGDEQRKDWLERYELGESPPKIAKKDGFDVRTVRTHIEMAKEERELKEARSTVLRNALELHYADLCGFSERLQSQILTLHTVSFTDTDLLLQDSLKQHIPRSPIWRYITKWNSLHQKITELKEKYRPKLDEEVRQYSKLGALPSRIRTGVVEAIIAASVFQFEQWTQGYRGLKLEEDIYPKQPSGVERDDFRYGFSRMGKVREEHVPIITEVFGDFETRIKEYDEYKDSEKYHIELRKLMQNLQDELNIIRLKRVVPGRCKYCPL